MNRETTTQSCTISSNSAQPSPDILSMEQCHTWDAICKRLRVENRRGIGGHPLLLQSYQHHKQCYTWSSVTAKHNVASRAQCTELYGCADKEQQCANVAVDSDEDEDEDEEEDE